MKDIKCKCGGIWFHCGVKNTIEFMAYAKPVDWDLEIEEESRTVYERNDEWKCYECEKVVKNKEDIKVLDALLRGDVQ